MSNRYVSKLFNTGEEFENYIQLQNSLVEGEYIKIGIKIQDGTTPFNLHSSFNNALKDWGDGTIDNLLTHTYANAGDYTITIATSTVGDSAFLQCLSLTSVTIGNSVTTIGNDAFNECTSLTSLTIGNSVISIGERAFRLCTSLTSLTIGNSVTTIGNSAFSGCVKLNSITIGDCVTSIGESAFAYCLNPKIYVPFNKLNTYKTQFSTYANYFDALVPASKAFGVSGTLTIAKANWSSKTYTATIADMGANDGIFFTPSTATDKANMEDANIFISTSGNTVTFTAETTPTTEINLKYFIARGM